MNYCVLIKVSKQVVTFWYQTEGSPYAALNIRHTNKIPLYFYVDGNDFFFGNLAKDRFFKNDPKAFGNYFEIIKDPSIHFDIYGNKKHVKQLFYHGIEQVLSHFINTVLYKSDAVESYRHFPLYFIYDADIEEQEKGLVEALFTEAGYRNVTRADFTSTLFAVLVKSAIIDEESPLLLLRSMDNTLFIHLYKNRTSKYPIGVHLEGHGADTRVNILAEMIIEYITSANPTLTMDHDRELAFILPYAKSVLATENTIFNGEVELRDGNRHWFRITARNLQERLKYSTNDISIYEAIDELLLSNGINNNSINMLLGSEELNTTYFSEKLLKKYAIVKTVEPVHLKDAMTLLFANLDFGKTVFTKPVLPPLPQKKPVVELPRKVAPPPLPTPNKAPEQIKNNIPPITT